MFVCVSFHLEAEIVLRVLYYIRELGKAAAVSGVCSGVLEENSGKVPGKLLEIFPEPQNATHSRISGTGKGKPAGNLGSTLPGPCPNLARGVFLKSTVPAFSSFSDYKEKGERQQGGHFGFPRLCLDEQQVLPPMSKPSESLQRAAKGGRHKELDFLL